MARKQHDEAKLPQWARDEIERLRMREREALAKVAEIGKPTPASRIVVDHMLPEHATGYAKSTRAAFRVGPVREDGTPGIGDGWVEIHINEDDHSIEVYSGGGRLSVEPRSSNVVRIRSLGH